MQLRKKSNCANLTSPYCRRRHFAKDNAMGLCQVALLREWLSRAIPGTLALPHPRCFAEVPGRVHAHHETAARGSECAPRLGSSWRPEQCWSRRRYKLKPTIRIFRFACRPTAVKATTSTVPTLRWRNATQQHQAAEPNAWSIPFLRRVHLRGVLAGALSGDNRLDVRPTRMSGTDRLDPYQPSSRDRALAESEPELTFGC